MTRPRHLPRGVVVDPVRPGQVSVWSFPRPPIVVADPRRVIVTLGGRVICRTRGAVKVLETSHPPTWYLPVGDFLDGSVRPTDGSSVCEYKGVASYFDLVSDPSPGGEGADVEAGAMVVAERAAWGYRQPMPGFEQLTGRIALYAGRVDSVTVDGELVRPQPGGFYGGWITDDVAGPFKGVPGSTFW